MSSNPGLLAKATAARPRPASAVPSRPTPAKVDAPAVHVIGKSPVREEPSSFEAGGVYTVSNEFNGYRHKDAVELPEDGVIVTVGTLRAFDEAARVPEGRVVIVDADPFITTYNRRLAAAVSKATDRYELMMWMTGADVGPAELERARQARSIEGDRTFIEALRQAPEGSTAAFAAEGRELTRPLEDGPLRWCNNRNQWCKALSSLAAAGRERGWAQHMLGSDSHFEAVRRAVSEGRVTALSGSLCGETTMPELAEALTRADEKVAAIDLSNVPDYVWSDAKEQLAKNLEALPKREDAWVFLTSATSAYRAGSDGFDYFAVPAKHFPAVNAARQRRQERYPETYELP